VIYVLARTTTNGIIKNIIENDGFEITQTKIEVGGIDLSISEGKVIIEQIRVSNPAGYNQPSSFTFDGIHITLDKTSLITNTIIVNEVFVENPHIFYGVNNKGESNILQIKENIQNFINHSKEQSQVDNNSQKKISYK
jgi:hypothetical protein